LSGRSAPACSPAALPGVLHQQYVGVFKGFHRGWRADGNGALAHRVRSTAGSRRLSRQRRRNRVFRMTPRRRGLARELGAIDVVYLDPPYNQHPYGSNYTSSTPSRCGIIQSSSRRSPARRQVGDPAGLAHRAAKPYNRPARPSQDRTAPGGVRRPWIATAIAPTATSISWTCCAPRPRAATRRLPALIQALPCEHHAPLERRERGIRAPDGRRRGGRVRGAGRSDSAGSARRWRHTAQ